MNRRTNAKSTASAAGSRISDVENYVAGGPTITTLSSSSDNNNNRSAYEQRRLARLARRRQLDNRAKLFSVPNMMLACVGLVMMIIILFSLQSHNGNVNDLQQNARDVLSKAESKAQTALSKAESALSNAESKAGAALSKAESKAESFIHDHLQKQHVADVPPAVVAKVPATGGGGGTVNGGTVVELSDEAIEMCNKALWHTIETTTIVMPNHETFIHTGDIDDLWLRDSAAQIHTLLIPLKHANGGRALIANDPQLDRIVSGLISRTAMYIRHDPYANAFRIDNTYVFSEQQKKLGRHDLISTWNYELDSACYYFRMIYLYWKHSPIGQANTKRSVLQLKMVEHAVEIMVDLWIAEQTHENDNFPKGPLFDCKNCNKPYRYPSLKRNGKGTPTNSTSGLTWTGFRPSDDECQYHYLIPANMFAAVALDYVVELATNVWENFDLANKARKLAKEINDGINEHGIVNHSKYGKIYAYEVDGLGNHNLMDDANVPSLLSIPYLGYKHDKQIYENTKRFIFSNDNPTYQSGTNPMTGHIEGYGSPHMSGRIKKNIWPMSIAIQGLTTSDINERKRLVELLVKASAGTHWMHESINVASPKDYTRSWFCWADSLFAELAMSITDKCPNTNNKYRVMEWRDPHLDAGGPYADS